jgi:hypothetical protein
MEANTDAARGEKKVEALHLEACRLQEGAEVGRDLAARHVQQGAVLGVEALAHQLGQGRAIARCRGDGAETQALGRAGRGVAHRQDRPATLLARFGQGARAVGAGQQHGLATGQRRGKLRRRMHELKPEQRRDHRRVAALGKRRGQRGCLAFRPDDQHAHGLSVAVT